MGCVDIVVVVVVVTHSVIIIMDALDVSCMPYCIISFIVLGFVRRRGFMWCFILENYVNYKKILRRRSLFGS